MIARPSITDNVFVGFDQSLSEFAIGFTDSHAGLSEIAIKDGQDFTLNVHGNVEASSFNTISFRANDVISNITITVANPGSGNRYYINGVLQQTLTLYRGVTYRFHQSDSSNSSHPFRLSTTNNGTHASGSQYTDGWTTTPSGGSYNPGNSGAFGQYVVPTDAPNTLYYYCQNHSNMGGTINILSGSVNTNGLVASNVSIQNQMDITDMNITSGLKANGSTGSSGQVLTSSGGGAMTWTTPSSFSGDIADYITHTSDSDTYFGFPGTNQFVISTGGIDRLNIDNTGITTIPDYIRHSGGDTDTYFGFPSDDTVSINTNGTERFRITSGGNIGIGTTTPQYPLHVIGAINLTGGLRANGFFGTAGQVLTASGGGGVNTWTTPSAFSGDIADYITHTSDSDTYFGFPGNNQFVISTGGIDRLNVDSSGNLTIPDYIRHSGDTDTRFGFMTNDEFVISTSGTDRFKILGTGYVGIGTSTPGAPLQIAASGSANPFTNGLVVRNSSNSSNQDAIVTLRVGGSSAGDPFISFDIQNEAGWAFGVDNSDSNKMKWSTNAANLTTTKMTLTTAGDLGIGTTSPGYKLDVTGTMNITSGLYANGSAGSSGQVLTSSGGGAMSWTTVSGGGSSPWTTSGSDIIYNTGNVIIGSYITHDGDSDTYFGFPGSNQFVISTGGIDRLNIDSSGRVGIGVTNPGAPLQIECADTSIHKRNKRVLCSVTRSYTYYSGIRCT